jgi:hypothetical protein
MADDPAPRTRPQVRSESALPIAFLAVIGLALAYVLFAALTTTGSPRLVEQVEKPNANPIPGPTAPLIPK